MMRTPSRNQSLPTCFSKVSLAGRQFGASLIVSLMLLVVLTLLGLSGMQSTIMQERMSSNSRDKMLAFQAAESAVREGENWLNTQVRAPDTVSSCATPPCDAFQLNASDLTGLTDQPPSWWQTNGRSYSGTLSGLAANPRFIVEQNSTNKGSLVRGTGQARSQRRVYRVTAQSVGGTDTAQAIVETMYAERFYGPQ